MTDDVPRAFLACRLPRAAQGDLVRRLADVRRGASARCYRWVRPEHWHLTLRFFGALPATRFLSVDTALASVASDTAAFACSLTAPRALPSWRQPNVVAFGVASGGALESLVERLGAALVDTLGAPDKPFLPHLSVLRLRRPRTSEVERVRVAFGEIDVAATPAFELTSMVLYRSDLLREGPRYTALRVYGFRPS